MTNKMTVSPFIGRVLLVMVGSIALLVCLSVVFFKIKSRSQQHKSSFFGYVLGLALEPSFTKVIWEWEDPHIVGESMSFILKVFVEIAICIKELVLMRFIFPALFCGVYDRPLYY